MPDSIEYTLGAVSAKQAEHEKILQHIQTTLEENTKVLAVHVERTDIAEENLAMLRTSFKPVEEHVIFVRKLGRLFVTSAGLITAIVALIRLMKG